MISWTISSTFLLQTRLLDNEEDSKGSIVKVKK